MTRRHRGMADPVERVIEMALDPGHFISYNTAFDFVRDLEQVEAQIQRLTPTEPARARNANRQREKEQVL